MIRQGIQTNFKDLNMRRWACYWFTLVAWSQFVSKREWTDDELIEKFYEHKSKNWVCKEPNSFLTRHAVAIFNDMAGVPDYFINVEHTNGNKDFPKTLRFPVFYERTAPDGFDHFALVEIDRNGNVRIVFDSWAISAASRGMIIKNFRRFR